jgi:hypothetical protein
MRLHIFAEAEEEPLTKWMEARNETAFVTGKKKDSVNSLVNL